MNCTICPKPITLVPSAKDRAVKFGGRPNDYTRLFTSHAECFIAKRGADTKALCAWLKEDTDGHNTCTD